MIDIYGRGKAWLAEKAKRLGLAAKRRVDRQLPERLDLTKGPLACAYDRAVKTTAPTIHIEWPDRRDSARTALVRFFMLAMSERTSDQGLEAYWRSTSEKMLRNSINLLLLADETISPKNIRRIIGSMPRSRDEALDHSFQGWSYCLELLDRCCEHRPDDVAEIGGYFLREIPSLPARVRRGITRRLHALTIA